MKILKTILAPFSGIIRWKYVLTPLAFPVYVYEQISQRMVLVFGIRIAVWTR